MFDKMQEKGLAYRREDLRFLPTLNCTRFISVITSTLNCTRFISVITSIISLQLPLV